MPAAARIRASAAKLVSRSALNRSAATEERRTCSIDWICGMG